MSVILATGELFTGYGTRSIGVVTEELIRSAKDEIQVMAYLITSLDFVKLLVSTAEKGIKVVVVVNSLQEQPEAVRKMLGEAKKRHEHFQVKEFCRRGKGSLHAKAIVADREKAIVGSANFTRAGMAGGNHEIAVLLDGRDAELLARLADCL